ncbi:MAG: cell division FtsA domain-containing protein, partial [Clostridia bacterium]|nr:cell division FtsA domain-containing protein [Clostridia bacterium]
FLSSSVSVVYGNGIVHEESFDFGAGHILMALMDGLNVEYEQAEEILLGADISGGATPKDLIWTSLEGNSYSVSEINEIIKYNLDEICERVDGFFSKYYRDKSVPGFAQNPVSLTGEGCSMVRGAAEHISKRLGRLTEVVAPDLPYYDKPAYSSQTALLALAIRKGESKGLKEKLFNIFGGKNK